jgi:hypothetical protein
MRQIQYGQLTGVVTGAGYLNAELFSLAISRLHREVSGVATEEKRGVGIRSNLSAGLALLLYTVTIVDQ